MVDGWYLPNSFKLINIFDHEYLQWHTQELEEDFNTWRLKLTQRKQHQYSLQKKRSVAWQKIQLLLALYMDLWCSRVQAVIKLDNWNFFWNSTLYFFRFPLGQIPHII